MVSVTCRYRAFPLALACGIVASEVPGSRFSTETYTSVSVTYVPRAAINGDFINVHREMSI